jgi:hypothetical protein
LGGKGQTVVIGGLLLPSLGHADLSVGGPEVCELVLEPGEVHGLTRRC